MFSVRKYGNISLSREEKTERYGKIYIIGTRERQGIVSGFLIQESYGLAAKGKQKSMEIYIL